MSSSATAPRDRFAGLLSNAAAAGSFSARRTASPDDLRLEVADIGPIALPVSTAQAQQLCGIGRPAQFGQGEQTLLDPGVRDTWEIPKSRISIDERQWNATLRPMLDRLRADLGLPQGCELAAEFHSMLVYAPGQFFAPHQDSEKSDSMIGTLAVVLPSASKGGVLTVEHGGRTASYRSSKEALTFVAFYADCRHHVRPVTSGYRIVLTYNLLLKGDTVALAVGGADPDLTGLLTECLNVHFGGSDKPTRLVYLLDHEYTERALDWTRLKGDDASRAALVRTAAQAADCNVILALAEVHEMWSAFDTEPSWRYDQYWDDDGNEESGSSEAYELQEIIESTTRLACWLDESDQAEPTSLTVFDDEVCATTPTAALSPHSSSYEGYMGNYGNTLDRWYRRAAIVLWPRRWDFAIRAQASPGWGLDRLADLLRAGDLAGAREGAALVTSFWPATMKGENLLEKTLAVAGDLDEPGLAAMLLAPFRIEALAPAHAPSLAHAAARYGESWTRDQIESWFGPDWLTAYVSPEQPLNWLAGLPAFCEALAAAPEADVLVDRLLIAAAWTRLRGWIETLLRSHTASHRRRELAALGPSVAAILTSTASIAATDLRDEVVGFLCQDNDDLLVCAIAALRAAHRARRRPRRESGFPAVAQRCADRLEQRLAQPTRAADDWSITLADGCGCNLCATLSAFLADPVRRTFEWPLAEQRRRHIHSRIDQAELPIDHGTRRTGRPYTLVLRKTDALFDHEEQERQRDQTDLAWLSRTRLIQHRAPLTHGRRG